MKKILLIFLLTMFVSLSVFAALTGDVDGNGKVGSADYILIRKHLLGTSKLTGDNLNRADTNFDGKVNTQDYIAIRKAIINKTTISTPTATSLANASSIDAYFLNTINRKSYGENYDSNDAFIFKTSNGKYILIDTGKSSEKIEETIYNELKKLQDNKKKVTVDYMILSHMHSDHIGNAKRIIKDANFEIKNLIIKRESISESDEVIVKLAKDKKINVIETNSLKEGTYFELSSNIKMYLFNVKDLYEKEDCSYKDYVVAITAGKEGYKYLKAKNKDTNKTGYIFFEGKDYVSGLPNTIAKYGTRDEVKMNIASDYRIKNTFWIALGNDGEVRSQCNSNSNSIGVLFQYNTTKGNKYMYIPSDMQNDGYSHLGEYDSNLGVVIHGHGSSVFYKYTKNSKGELIFEIKDGALVVNKEKSKIKKASAYITAKTMVKKFPDLAGNITIYQMAHHGINGYPEVAKLLKINSEIVYAISPSRTDPATINSFARGDAVYIIRNSKQMYTGGETKNGIKCSIKKNGTTSCAYY